MDAKYWGVPQCRKRIFLVADFRDERAGEILFKPDSLPGDLGQGGEAREGIAADAERGFGETEYLTRWDTQNNRIFSDRGGAPTLSGCDGGGGRNPVGVILPLSGNAEKVVKEAVPINTQIITRGKALGERTGFGMGNPAIRRTLYRKTILTALSC